MSILPQKRPASDGGFEEFPRPRVQVQREYFPPAGKVKYLDFSSAKDLETQRLVSYKSQKENHMKKGVQIQREFPLGCRRPLSSIDNGKMVLGRKTTNQGPVEVRKSFTNLRPAARKVNLDIHSEKDRELTQRDVNKSQIVNDRQKEISKREKIKEAIRIFNEVHDRLFQENRSKPKGEKIAYWRVSVEAAKIVKQQLKWVDEDKRIGSISGIEIGDEFHYRSQLQMIGLHCQPNCGIDYINENGNIYAISIVDSHRYSNKRESYDVFYYSGQGGVKFLGSKPTPEDQKLERGNLALTNSKNSRNPVRVIRKVQKECKDEVFVYDGLYNVTGCTRERGSEGKLVFMFKLTRIPGQPQILPLSHYNCTIGCGTHIKKIG